MGIGKAVGRYFHISLAGALGGIDWSRAERPTPEQCSLLVCCKVRAPLFLDLDFPKQLPRKKRSSPSDLIREKPYSGAQPMLFICLPEGGTLGLPFLNLNRVVAIKSVTNKIFGKLNFIIQKANLIYCENYMSKVNNESSIYKFIVK